MLELDARVAPEGYNVRDEEAIGRLDEILGALRSDCGRRAGWVSSERERHRLPAPVITAAAPLFCPCALPLWGAAVVKEKPGVTLQRREHRVVRERERRACEVA